MFAPKTAVDATRASEERMRRAIEDAVTPILGTTPEKRVLLRASFEAPWKHGERSPIQAAADAWEVGDMDLHEAALANDARLATLAKAARTRA